MEFLYINQVKRQCQLILTATRNLRPQSDKNIMSLLYSKKPNSELPLLTPSCPTQTTVLRLRLRLRLSDSSSHSKNPFSSSSLFPFQSPIPHPQSLTFIPSLSNSPLTSHLSPPPSTSLIPTPSHSHSQHDPIPPRDPRLSPRVFLLPHRRRPLPRLRVPVRLPRRAGGAGADAQGPPGAEGGIEREGKKMNPVLVLFVRGQATGG